MPIYEYQCDSCGGRREIIVRQGQAARPSCETCRKRMKRVISQTAFILKGAGWYVTDYPSDARKKGLESEKPAVAAPAAEKKEAPPEKKAVAPAPAPGKKRRKKGD